MKQHNQDVWENIRHQFAQKPIQLGLERVVQVWHALGGKQPPVTILVGGTNGKGSCCALLDSILRSAGYQVGLYTSPHLLSFRERIRIDGVMVSDEALGATFQRIARTQGAEALTQFELDTLVAIEIMNEANIDVAILEVGMGGRLDAVNIIDADAALVTNIDLDHQEWLGETREVIALEKAGIYRTGCPAVLGDPQVPASLLRYAEEQGVNLCCQGRDFRFSVGENSWDWQGRDGMLEGLPFPALQGRHQFLNAAAVLQLLQLMNERLPIAETAIRQGLEKVVLPGRFQFIPGQPAVLIDVAHNPQAVRALAEYLRETFPGRRIRAIFAIMRDKDIAKVVQGIADLVSAWYLAPLAIPRAATVTELLPLITELTAAPVNHSFANVTEAYMAAQQDAADADLIVVFGSFFLVAEFLAQLSPPK